MEHAREAHPAVAMDNGCKATKLVTKVKGNVIFEKNMWQANAIAIQLAIRNGSRDPVTKLLTDAVQGYFVSVQLVGKSSLRSGGQGSDSFGWWWLNLFRPFLAYYAVCLGAGNIGDPIVSTVPHSIMYVQ
ncbi:hypothetical protein VOLCADRAFT_86364 [Volvox carteri f. nagariensis]|uniref:Uncharacterized protein n=1 Tax=Volvox carteri f. nagariensis TaxID=3068 RepID=D8TIK6_VOLCA|nr:uncharacterized protein VOLCADRAFT_86364 [Volvox carteri f. nagariensis]EFJ52904.1 hypothetical protein VOLCADRAFT_86364 [Volvox carteri f. nagariensis]|eukprot:XP_002945909.1 hypothetical protein VOLCADRAFT_86364 [Volvox carteri f. nagariensis]